MRQNLFPLKSVLLMSLLTFFVACSNDDATPMPQPEPIPMPEVAPLVEFTALSNDNRVFYFNARNLGSPIRSFTISGLPSGESIISIDYRPATGQLYGLGSSSRLYLINESTGLASPLGAAAFTPQIEGTSSSIDFNPTVDRIRLVSNNGQNLRLHPDLGTVVATDGNLNPGTPSVTAAAYTNNFAQTTSTQLFVIDTNNDSLYLQNPPNDGTLVLVGSLGVNATSMNGFDIGGNSNQGFAILTVGGEQAIYRINVATGAATKVVNFSPTITSMAIGLGF